MIRVGLRRGPITVAAAYAALDDPGSGGVVVFAGRTRPDPGPTGRIARLDYEADRRLALRSLREIAGRATERFGLRKVVLWHRTGPVAVGKVSVIVGAAAPHRGQAFRGARWMIDRLKVETPIWKTARARPGRPPRRRPGRRAGR